MRRNEKWGQEKCKEKKKNSEEENIEMKIKCYRTKSIKKGTK